MATPIPLDSFRALMQDWNEFDWAEYKLAICLGILPPDDGSYANFFKYKPIWWSSSALGEFLYSTLQSLVNLGVLEFDKETLRFRWNRNYSPD